MNDKNKKIEVSESSLKAALKVADESTKKVLVALFGNVEPRADNKPSLRDYKTIRSYEDACKALGERVYEETLSAAGAPKHIIAQMKLELICKALWGGRVRAYPDPDGERSYWYPILALYHQREICNMGKKERGCLLSAPAFGGAGFGCLLAYSRSSWYSLASGGFRLCLDTEEKAEYFGKQFLELWAEAMGFDFTVGERLK